MRYLLTLEYDGAAYAGWQRQKNAVTVQEKVETALRTLLGVKTVVYASGRTDAGVHAAGQAAHFDSERVLDKERFRYSLNALLPDDVKAVALREVPSDFHAKNIFLQSLPLPHAVAAEAFALLPHNAALRYRKIPRRTCFVRGRTRLQGVR